MASRVQTNDFNVSKTPGIILNKTTQQIGWLDESGFISYSPGAILLAKIALGLKEYTPETTAYQTFETVNLAESDFVPDKKLKYHQQMEANKRNQGAFEIMARQSQALQQDNEIVLNDLKSLQRQFSVIQQIGTDASLIREWIPRASDDEVQIVDQYEFKSTSDPNESVTIDIPLGSVPSLASKAKTPPPKGFHIYGILCLREIVRSKHGDNALKMMDKELLMRRTTKDKLTKFEKTLCRASMLLIIINNNK